jgi:uroporphyrinogen-III synthase
MRVLVTRPVEDAHETAVLLKARGHDPLVAPLLSVRYHDSRPLHLDGVQGLLATSANGVRAFARATSRRDFAVFAVGSQTSEAARAAGFRDIHDADGNAEDLARVVRAAADPKSGTLIHAAGAEAEGRLAAALSDAGYDVRSEILYDVPAVTALPDAVREAWRTLDAVLLFSARSAQAFADCAAGLACDGLIACCISAAAAKPLAPLTVREIRIAARPNQGALLDTLD